MRLAGLFAFFLALALGAEKKAVFPPNVKPAGPYSPGVIAGNFVYVSAQGARTAAGELPPGIESQTKQSLENVKAVIEASGLTMDHVVQTQVLLVDQSQYEAVNRVYSRYFPRDAPSRVAYGVARLPEDTPVSISAIAVRDLKLRTPIQLLSSVAGSFVSPAVKAGQRVYVSGVLGRAGDTNRIPSDPAKQAAMAFERLRLILKAGSLGLRDLAVVNVYLTPALPEVAAEAAMKKYLQPHTTRIVTLVQWLPSGANIEVAGVASRDPKNTGDCTEADGAVYCGAISGNAAAMLATAETDLRPFGLSVADSVFTTLFVDNLDNFGDMEREYAGFVSKIGSARTALQPRPQGESKKNSIALIAVK